jgi:hypothetical protein
MDSAGGNKDEPTRAGLSSGFDQSERANDISLGEFEDIPFGSAKSFTGAGQGGMDYCVASTNQLLRCCWVIQVTEAPIHVLGFQTRQIAGWTVPAAKRMSRPGKLPDQVTTDKASGSGDGDFHLAVFLQGQRLIVPAELETE